MRYLFFALQELRGLLRRRKFIILDYDGTLTPIVERPELAVLHKDMSAILKKLAAKYPIAIISGRALKELKNLVKVDGIYYAGNHGFEISNDTEYIHPNAALTQPIIREVCSKLDRKLKRIKGVIVENKGLTASVHYRLVSNKDMGRLRLGFREVVLPYLKAGELNSATIDFNVKFLPKTFQLRSLVKITKGKKVLEIRPNVAWDKGKAIRWLIKETKMQDFFPIYFGDDRTDEDAFRALRYKGTTVLVTKRKKKSYAKYYVRNISEVKRFLTRLLI